MSALALLESTETAISSTQHKYKHISFNEIVASALTPSNLIYKILDVVQHWLPWCCCLSSERAGKCVLWERLICLPGALDESTTAVFSCLCIFTIKSCSQCLHCVFQVLCLFACKRREVHTSTYICQCNHVSHPAYAAQQRSVQADQQHSAGQALSSSMETTGNMVLGATTVGLGL